MASFSGGVCPTLTLVGKAMGSTGGVSSLGGCLNNEGWCHVPPKASVEFDSVSLASVVVDRVVGSPWGITASQFTVSRVVLSRFWKMSHLLKVICPPHILHQLHNTHCQRLIIQEDWWPSFLCPIL